MLLKSLWSLAAAAALLVAPAAIAAGAPPKTPELLEKGRASFAKNCVVCHGAKGEGDGVAGKSLRPPPRNFVTEPLKVGSKATDVFKLLETGSKGTGMLAFKHLPEEERWALSYYVLSLHQPKK